MTLIAFMTVSFFEILTDKCEMAFLFVHPLTTCVKDKLFSQSRHSPWSRSRIHDPLRNANMRRGHTFLHNPRSHNPIHSRSHGRTVSTQADRWRQPRRTLPRPIGSPVRAGRSDRQDVRRVQRMNRPRDRPTTDSHAHERIAGIQCGRARQP